MNKFLFGSLIAAVALSGCEEKTEAPLEEETLGDYKALGTEPGWTAEIKGKEIIFTTMEGNNFTLPVSRMIMTETGWTVKGFSDQHNINLYVTLGEQCSDGMSDRKYADTVKVQASKSGTLNGCGGDITEGDDGAP